MIVVMQEGASEEQIQAVVRNLMDQGFDVHRSTGALQTVLGGVGAKTDFDTRVVELMEGVQEVHPVVAPYKLASRHFRPEGTVVDVGRGVKVGGEQVVVMAGPCSVESAEQMDAIAQLVARLGVRVMRGGAFKPRTSPYSFQGLGQQGLEIFRQVADRYNLVVVSEVMDQTQIPMMLDYVDIMQVGARNMQNYNLLRELGKVSKPVLLKRGIAATLEELLLSAEYMMSGGNYNVILCERGIRTFESSTRNTLDLSAVPVIHKLSHLPIIADPSHATGRRDKVLPMARAAVAAGADGILVEVHHDPDRALSDGPQALFPEQFEQLMRQLRVIAEAVDRSV
ncbi:MAG TPA: 3-deoxy-7-phosphoheptulonate synthase [Terriglobia bacterium]|jgi:3-deoxy-7-phosphoheptulonate synthase|nr:3-deoxy-7-phosphoheptulonate synthase [Terriglobia bacterium]